MADRTPSIYGTERDKVNCSFYFKIGACRHGDRCSRKHVKPAYSQTVLISKVYQNPSHKTNCRMTSEELQQHFDDFFEDMFIELAKYGEIEKLNVCDNVGDHLVGNVYVIYKYEDVASKAVDSLNDRFYAGQPIFAELSPVTDFGEACCRQYENSECVRNGFCNFMHLKAVSRKLEKKLYASQEISLEMLSKSKKYPTSHSSRSHRSNHSKTPPERASSRKRYSPYNDYESYPKTLKTSGKDVHANRDRRRADDKHCSDDRNRADDKHRADDKYHPDEKHRSDDKYRYGDKNSLDDRLNHESENTTLDFVRRSPKF